MKVVLVSLSDGIDDPRPFRTAQVLADAGHTVTQVGYTSNVLVPGIRNWEYIGVDPKPVFSSIFRLLLGRLVILIGPSGYAAEVWLKRLLPKHLKSTLESYSADCYIAMDYSLLPMLAELSDRYKGRLCYEAREYYQGQNHSDFLWKISMPRVIRRIEGTYINKCSIITTVSKGISKLLFENYGLRDLPEVVYGFPKEEVRIRNKHSYSRKLVFHGNLSSDREVIRFIRAFDFEKAQTTFTIRGNGSKEYVKALRSLTSSRRYRNTVNVEKSVPYSDLIRVTAEYDFGLIPWQNMRPQKKFSMPNKLFEYLTAGLPIICTNGSEIADLVKEHNIGLVFSYDRIQLLVDGLRELDDSNYEIMKKNVSQFVQNFGFIKQSRKILDLYNNLS